MHEYMPYLVVAVVEAVVIIALIEDCILVRRDRKSLEKHVSDAEWKLTHSCKRNSELASERDAFRERNRQLVVEYNNAIDRLKVQTELAESYHLMAS